MVDTKNGHNRPPMPQVLTQIWGTPMMKAALQLSGGGFTDRRYYAGIMNLSEIASFYSPEKWTKHCQAIAQNYPDGVPGMTRDVNILCDAIMDWEDVREIWRGWLLTTVCMPYIFTRLSKQGKVQLSDLSMDDRAMFAYTEQQMESFRQTGIAILAFGEAKDRVGALLKEAQ